MSRGPGYMQRWLFQLLLNIGKPMTFADIRAAIIKEDGILRLTVERSLRRSLLKMVADQTLMALGKGGPGDPHRYCVHPILAAMILSKEQYEQHVRAIESDLAS